MTMYGEYSKITKPVTDKANKCALATVGIGLNRMEIVTTTLKEVVLHGVDVSSTAILHHNKVI